MSRVQPATQLCNYRYYYRTIYTINYYSLYDRLTDIIIMTEYIKDNCNDAENELQPMNY